MDIKVLFVVNLGLGLFWVRYFGIFCGLGVEFVCLCVSCLFLLILEDVFEVGGGGFYFFFVGFRDCVLVVLLGGKVGCGC